MKVCLVCAEFFGWDSRGGFGYATRIIGRELVKQGIEVTAIVPRPGAEPEQCAVLDGVTVRGVDRTRLWQAGELSRQVDADIYHSQNPSLLSWFVQRAMPDRVHVATLRDPRTWGDWWTELRHPTRNPLQVMNSAFFYENPMARHAMRTMHALYVPAHFLVEKSMGMYGLTRPPGVLPTPVAVPERVEKSSRPRVIFVGRWDRVKRPERFFRLARELPDVDFVAIGKAHNLDYEKELRSAYGHIPNLDMVGYVDQFTSDRLSQELGRAWILVNTSAKEALPNTFVEAAAHRCAIVAGVDPDQYASRFGRYVKDDDYAAAISALLAGDEWCSRGQRAFESINTSHALAAATQRHIENYAAILGGNRD
jgi:glycosyltransferase involved in cell wall biosynthesis